MVNLKSINESANFLVIEVPSNANTMFAGRVIDSATTESQAEIIANQKTHIENRNVQARQWLAGYNNPTGVSATEIAAVQYAVISEDEWNAEFKRRSER